MNYIFENMKNFSEWIDRLFNQYRFVRRFMLFWIVGLLSLVTYQIFWNTKGELSTEYIALTGLLTVVIGLYQWIRSKEGD